MRGKKWEQNRIFQSENLWDNPEYIIKEKNITTFPVDIDTTNRKILGIFGKFRNGVKIMKKSNIILICIITSVVILAIVAISSYNGIVSKHEAVKSSLSDLDVMLQRRADLVPNLVSTVKGYASHETEIINKVTDARTKLVNANSMEEKSNANNELSDSLNALMVVVENYPDLKANEIFKNLQIELTGTEDKIAFARQFYNDTVQHYNTAIMVFPNNIMANIMKYKEREYFKVDENEKQVVKVEL